MKKSKNFQCTLFLMRRLGFVTLLEVIIAMSLTILVLTTLTYFYRQVYVIGSNLDEVQKKSFQMRYVENVLSDILPKAVSEKDKEKDFVFFTTPAEGGLTNSPSLIFTYNNGVDIDKPFSGHVIGRLFVDPKDRLILAYWPSPKRWEGSPTPPMKKEILMENVDSLSLEFFVAPKKETESQDESTNNNNKKEVDPEPQGAWHGSWSSEFNQLPAMIRLNLTLKDKEKLMFIFPFSNTKRQISYDQ